MYAARAPHASRAARAARHSNCTRCAHSASVATTPARYVQVIKGLNWCVNWGRAGKGVCGEGRGGDSDEGGGRPSGLARGGEEGVKAGVEAEVKRPGAQSSWVTEGPGGLGSWG